MNEREGVLRAAFFCVGLGASNAWWLSITSSPLLWGAGAPLALSAGSLIVHAAYLLMQIACVVAASRAVLGFARPRMFVVSAGVCALGTVLLIVSTACALPPAVAACGVAVASCGGALLFLCWMSPFTALVGDGMPGSVFLLATVVGTVLWFVTTRINDAVALVALAVLPLLSAAALFGMPTARGEMAAQGRAPRCAGASPRAPLRALFPLAFVAGLFIYELPVGFVTGTASVSAVDASNETLFGVYGIYTVVIAIVAGVDFALARHERCSALLYRFVVPLISIGLIVLALARSQDQVLASAMVLAGTILFEMFILTALARIALASGESPWRIFGFGGAVMEAALCGSFFLGLWLAGSANFGLTAIALGLVFVFILAGSFDIPGRDLAGAGASVGADSSTNPYDAEAGQPEPLASPEAAAQERIDRFARAFGLSVRETEVLALIARGRSVQAAADELFVAHSTVKTHIGHIYEKAGVSNRQDLLKLVDGLEPRDARR